MKLYPNIEFNNNLIENKETTITYSGYLFQKNSDSVSIVFGFGNNWEHTTETKMEKKSNGFVAEITALEYTNFNFCFKNSNNEWDNNNNQNYIAPISKPKSEVAFIINENVIENIINNIIEIDLSKSNTENNVIFEEEQVNNTYNFEENQNCVENITEDFSVVNENTIEEFEINIENEEPLNIEDTVVNVVEETILTEDINNALSETNESSPDEEPIENINSDQNENITSEEFNIDNLVKEILAPVQESVVFNNEEIEDSNVTDNFKELNFESGKNNEDQKVDTLIDNLISDLYEKVNTNLELYSKENIEDTFSNNIINDLNNNLIENEIETSQDEIVDNTKLNNLLEDEHNKEDSQNSTLDFNELDLEDESLLENLDAPVSENLSLVELDDSKNFIVSPRKINKFYLFKKKVKIAFYKLFSLPKNLFFGFSKD